MKTIQKHLGITFILLTLAITMPVQSQDKKVKYNKLTAEEESVIIHKGTEMPYSGKYYYFDEEGVYTCKRCDAPLYRSEDKFNANCGWPSFGARSLLMLT